MTPIMGKAAGAAGVAGDRHRQLVGSKTSSRIAGAAPPGTLDWSTELLPVMHTAAGDVVDVGDMALGVAVALKLPDSFAGYNAVYHLATMGPFFACGGGCPLDSVPIPQGQTFSFYVTGGLASPMVYFDQADFRADGSLNLTFNGGSIPAAIPEPGAALLLGVGWATIALLHRRRCV